MTDASLKVYCLLFYLQPMLLLFGITSGCNQMICKLPYKSSTVSQYYLYVSFSFVLIKSACLYIRYKYMTNRLFCFFKCPNIISSHWCWDFSVYQYLTKRSARGKSHCNLIYRNLIQYTFTFQLVKSRVGNDRYAERGMNTFNEPPKLKSIQTIKITHTVRSSIATNRYFPVLYVHLLPIEKGGEFIIFTS